MATTFRCVLTLLAFAAAASALEKCKSVYEKEVNPTFTEGFLQKSSDFTFEQKNGYPYRVPYECLADRCSRKKMPDARCTKKMHNEPDMVHILSFEVETQLRYHATHHVTSTLKRAKLTAYQPHRKRTMSFVQITWIPVRASPCRPIAS